MKYHGYAHTYGHNVNTDAVLSPRYTNSSDPGLWAAHCLEDMDPGFTARVRPGDFIVAGANFGCGSSKEQAARALAECGVSVVVASSFGSIFYRNAVNMGLALIECADAVEDIRTGDELEADLESGLLLNLSTGVRHTTSVLPDFMRAIVRAGGLIPFTRAYLADSGR